MENKINYLKESPIYAMSLCSKELFHSNFWAWLMEQDESFIEIFFKNEGNKQLAGIGREDGNRDVTVYRKSNKDDKKEKSEQRYMERIRLIKDRVVNTRPEMDLENAKIMTESFKETAGEPLCIRKAKAFRRQCREKTVKIWDQELIVGCSGMIMKQRMR